MWPTFRDPQTDEERVKAGKEKLAYHDRYLHTSGGVCLKDKRAIMMAGSAHAMARTMISAGRIRKGACSTQFAVATL